MKRIGQIWQRMPLGAKASIAFFAAKAISAGIQYIQTPLYTRLLTPAEYGQVTVFLTWVQILGIIAMFCLSYGVFNNGMIDFADKRDEYALSLLILSNLITIGFSVVLLALYPKIKTIIGLDLPLIVLMCVLFFFQPAYNFFLSRQRFELRYKVVVVATVLSVLLPPIAAIFCIFHTSNHLYGQLFGSQGALILLYSIFYIYIVAKGGKVQTKYWKSAFLFNLPLIPHYLSQYLLNHSDRLMIAWLVGNQAAAYYSVAYSVAMAATVLWTAMYDVLLPYTYEKCSKNDYASISRVTLPILTGFAVLCFFVILLAPEVVSLMATKDYQEAIYVIPPIVGGVFFQVQYMMCANIIYYHKKPNYVMFASITATLLNLILNYIFICRYGYIAAGYTTLVSYMVQAIIDYIVMNKVVQRQVYNAGFLLALAACVIVTSLLCPLLYSHRIIRYMCVAMIFIVCLVFRKKAVSLYYKIKNK